MDKTVFLAARGEHYYVALLCLVVASGDALWISACKVIWCAIWFWAATSKVNHHFPERDPGDDEQRAVLPDMAQAAALRSLSGRPPPVAPRDEDGARRHLHRVHDPARAARLEREHARDGADARRDDGLPRLHLRELSERDADRVEHPDGVRRLLPVRVPSRGQRVRRSARCRCSSRSSSSASSASRCFGNFFPARVSFLLSMRYYAGNWAYNIWLFKKGATAEARSAHEARRHDGRAAPLATPRRADGAGRAGARDVAPLHAPRGTAAAGSACRARSMTSKTTSGTRARSIGGSIIGWNFGDGHLNGTQLLEAVQAQCGFEEGELRVVMVESQPLFGTTMQWKVVDAKSGLVDAGETAIGPMRDVQPWPTGAYAEALVARPLRRAGLSARADARARTLDAVVIGSGPNGLAAAVALARQGASVRVFEADAEIGGGTRSRELTLPGFVHDVCSAVHPMGILSPFFRHASARRARPRVVASAGLRSRIRWRARRAAKRSCSRVRSTRPPRRSVAMDRRIGGSSEPLLADPHALLADILAPLRIPEHPLAMLRFGWRAAFSANRLARLWFRDERARALFAGCAAHSILPLTQPLTAALGLLFTLHRARRELAGREGRIAGHRARAGVAASKVSAAASRRAAHRDACAIFPIARVVLFDTSPAALARIAGDALARWLSTTARALPLRARRLQARLGARRPDPVERPGLREASTVHVGGTLEEICASERDMYRGRLAERPFLILCQQSAFDASRAPAGKHTGYAYCHVPHGSTVGPHRGDRSAGRALRARLSRPHPGAPRDEHRRLRALRRELQGRRDHRRRGGSSSSSPARSRGSIRTRRPIRGCSSARRRHRRVAACTGNVATGRRDRLRSGSDCAERLLAVPRVCARCRCDSARSRRGRPPRRDALVDLLQSPLKGCCLVTYRPHELPASARAAIDFVIALPGGKAPAPGEGQDPLEALAEMDGVGSGASDAQVGEATIYQPGDPRSVRRFRINQRRSPHVRHWRKYRSLRLPTPLHFLFRDAQGVQRGARPRSRNRRDRASHRRRARWRRCSRRAPRDRS